VKNNGEFVMPPVDEAHRLGTELSLIFAYCDQLRQNGEAALSPNQVLILSRIQRSAENIRDLRAEIWHEPARAVEKTAPAMQK